MKKIRIDNGRVQTSVLGFGCVGTTAHQTEADALRTLETAFESGITHFDVARLYGFGQAEGILGKFAKQHRNSITITTKFGLNPPQTFTKYKRFLNVARQAVRKFTFLKSLLKKPKSNLVKFRAFSVKEAKDSLEISLKELNIDYIDFWLLHECLPEDAGNHDLLDFLNLMIQEGKILHYGVGTNYENIQSILNLEPCNHQVIQFEQSLQKQNIQKLQNLGDKLVITHSVLKEASPIFDAAMQQIEFTKHYSNRIGLNLSSKQEIIGLLLAYASFVNPNGIVLFSSIKPEHVSKNIKIIEERNYSEETFLIFLDFLKKISYCENKY